MLLVIKESFDINYIPSLSDQNNPFPNHLSESVGFLWLNLVVEKSKNFRANQNDQGG